jgi:hypothetical protein
MTLTRRQETWDLALKRTFWRLALIGRSRPVVGADAEFGANPGQRAFLPGCCVNAEPAALLVARCVNTDAASDLADLEAFGLLKTLPAAPFSPADGVLRTSSTDHWLDTSATRFDCCLSQATLDGGKGRLMTKELPLDVGEAIEAVAKLLLPDLFEGFTMLVS